MSLIKLPFIYLVTLGLHAAFTVPGTAPQKEERVVMKDGPIPMRLVAKGKFSFWIAGILESAMILSDFVSRRPQDTPLYLTWLSATGAFMVAIGAYIRQRCYEKMGPMFTIEVCLRKDHKLITHGPYSVVRHPSYSGGLIAIVGAVIWFWGPGSFLRETDTTAIRILGFVVTTTAIWPCFLIPNRVKSEDEALQKAFGAEWESWAQRVPYRLFPGIY